MAAVTARGRPGCVFALDWRLDTNKRSTSAAQLLPVAHQAVHPMMLLLAPGQTNTQRPGEVMLHLNHHSQPDRLRKTVLARRQFHGTQEETLINPTCKRGVTSLMSFPWTRAARLITASREPLAFLKAAGRTCGAAAPENLCPPLQVRQMSTFKQRSTGQRTARSRLLEL